MRNLYQHLYQGKSSKFYDLNEAISLKHKANFYQDLQADLQDNFDEENTQERQINSEKLVNTKAIVQFNAFKQELQLDNLLKEGY